VSLIDRVRAALRPEYDVQQELGAGGMGVVFLAHEIALRRMVAVKVLRPELATAEGAHNFLQEARALAQVTHPAVVAIHAVLPERDGLFFFVMEYIEGETLHQRLRRGPLPVREVAHLGDQLLAGLAKSHRAGVIHCDIKPGNIFLTERGAVLGDFGIARVLGDTDHGRSSSTGGGFTPDYAAPEQRSGRRPTARTDLYQMGAVLYEAATTRRWSAVASDARQRLPGIPGRLAHPLRRALEWEERNRWADASEFRRALAASQRWPPALLATLGVALVVLIASLIWRPPRAPLQPRVELTLLRFAGSDSAVATQLGRYTGEPLERFARIAVRPMTVSLHRPWPTRQEQIDFLNTRYYVTGEVSADSTVALGVFDGRGRQLRQIRVPRPPGGDPGSSVLLRLGHAAADSLVNRLFHEHYPAYRDVGGLGGSEDALAVDEFLRGEEEFHRDAYRAAEAHYRKALEYDPHFAVALWQLTLVHRWLRTLTLRELQDLDRRYRALLPPQYQALLAAQLKPTLAARFAAYQEAMGRFPENGYAVLLYADELYHRGALEGIPLDSALTMMEAAARLDPYLDQAPAYDHTVWANIRLGREAEAEAELARREEVVARARASSEAEGARRARFLRLAWYERFRPRLVPWLRAWKFWRPDSVLLRRTAEYARLGLSFDVPESERALGEMLRRHAIDLTMAAQGHEAQGLGLMMLGRAREALSQFDSADFRTAEIALERQQWRLLPSILGLPVPDSGGLPRARAALAQLSADSRVGVRTWWTLALASIDRGDSAAAAPWLTRLAAAAARDSAAARLHGLLQAFRAGRAGRLEVALTLSRPLLRYHPSIRAGDPFARSVLYLYRAEWFERLGRWQEASRTLVWFLNADIDGWAPAEAQAGEIDAVAGVLARLRRGALLLDHDQSSEACRDLRRVAELWRDADPGYAALKQRLGGLLRRCRQ
jgi:serine/threonine protein kinase/tetratricopeptide (TPR) repeat protein